ncbi:PF20097 family protein [uncultured Clostridium sp.]|uniref:PF20097 family protein n=1 Tax=uncultured Clostridium sp. TaxID=59620 RepID=UPI002633218A|nr:PF20097 family protein [uncultured Clostridium sp.]
MKCPYCAIKMVEGELIGDRYANTWRPKERDVSPKYIYLKRKSFWSYAPIVNTAFVCSKCNKMIIDLDVEMNKEKSIL